MTWNIRSTYYYLVCFATLLMVVVGASQAVGNVLDLVLPPDHYRPTPMDVYERYRVGPPGEREEVPFTRQELEEMAAEEEARMRAQQRRNAIRGLLGNLALVLIAAPIYVYHWRAVRRSEG